jgi:hypothetical protein
MVGADEVLALLVDALLADVVVGPNSPLRYPCTSVGSAVNQEGVLLSRKSDQSIRETAGTLVRARAKIDGGTPVASTAAREPLHTHQFCSLISKAQGWCTHRSISPCRIFNSNSSRSTEGAGVIVGLAGATPAHAIELAPSKRSPEYSILTCKAVTKALSHCELHSLWGTRAI